MGSWDSPRFTGCRGFLLTQRVGSRSDVTVSHLKVRRGDGAGTLRISASRQSAGRVDVWGDQREFSESPALTLTGSFNVTQQSVDRHQDLHADTECPRGARGRVLRVHVCARFVCTSKRKQACARVSQFGCARACVCACAVMGACRQTNVSW